MTNQGETNTAWCISIKPVGAEYSKSSDSALSKDFVIEVSPDDDVSALYERIEGVTGLKATQQRLIYRGRLIGGSKRASLDIEQVEVQGETHDNSAAKVKDITGLCDGHTIHLVRKRERGEESSQETANGLSDTTAEDADAFSASSSAAAPLLAALLGLGSTEDGDERSTDAGRRWRSARYGTSRRRFHHRLTHEDLEISDPGSLEAVRQGMMTLHTLIPAARQPFLEQQQRLSAYPNRQWYVGQWIDCLDTVNQWLEATVVEVVDPDAILPPRSDAIQGSTRPSPSFSSGSEPFVTAGDLEGRRRLLLETCEEGSIDDEGGDLAGYRRRDNEGVQLLLIHYNGWPHRWDEWIRSDSERLRPFRVRTRHSNSSPPVSPSPQSLYAEAPSTYIRNSDALDREAFLPELSRLLTIVNELVSQAAKDVEVCTHSSQPYDEQNELGTNNINLPWRTTLNTELLSSQSVGGENVEEEKLQGIDSGEAVVPSAQTVASQRSATTRRELLALAPLLDRLGRTLVDSASHVAYLATNLAETENLGGNAQDLERIEEHPTSLGGLLSLLSRDRRRQSLASNNVVVPSDNVSNTESIQTGVASEDSGSIDPDHSDFASGLVNTTRGEVRRGPRSRNQNDDAAGILGAYLAAASLGSAGIGGSDNDEAEGNMQGLGRLLRERGNGNGGIDIHIHAVVTSPGMPTGAPGITTFGGGGAGTGLSSAINEAGGLLSSTGRSNRGGAFTFATNQRSAASTVAPTDDDDMGIFAELYSESPEPVNPNQSPLDGDSLSSTGRRDVNTSLSRNSNSPLLSRNLMVPVSNTRRQSFSRLSSRSINEQNDGSRRSGSGASMFRRFFRRSND